MEDWPAYAKQKKCGHPALVSWKTLDDQTDPRARSIHNLGRQGHQGHFMQRSDQLMINFYYKVARETAKRKSS